jgi:hypothetical protein
MDSPNGTRYHRLLQKRDSSGGLTGGLVNNAQIDFIPNW